MGKNLVWSGMTALALVLAGCGHTDEEMAAKQREIDKLAADLKAAKSQIADDQAKYAEATGSIASLKEQVKQLGGDNAKLTQAVAEYKQRAEQLAIIEARFRDLRTKLDKLTQVGVKVVPRNNRLVVQLPGDILFDSGKDELKQSGKDVLAQVAEVIRGDKDLANRYFVVSGHTDNVKYPAGGQFKDNWGLSLMRARTVNLFLVDPTPADPKKKGSGGGNLNPRRWSAAGFAEFDPIAGTVEQQSKEDQSKNRRVELVVQPNVEEMLNLGNIK